MEIIRKLRRLESRLARTVNDAAQKVTQATPSEPLEIVHAIIESVEKRLEPAGRGQFVFPFNRIRICIAAASTEICARFEAVFASEPTLQDRIFQTLKAAGCNSNDLSIEVTYVDHTAGEWTRSAFKVEFERVPGLPQP